VIHDQLLIACTLSFSLLRPGSPLPIGNTSPFYHNQATHFEFLPYAACCRKSSLTASQGKRFQHLSLRSIIVFKGTDPEDVLCSPQRLGDSAGSRPFTFQESNFRIMDNQKKYLFFVCPSKFVDI